MTREEKKKYLRLIYAKTFRLLGVGLVISALVGGIYHSTMHAVWARVAAGVLMYLVSFFI